MKEIIFILLYIALTGFVIAYIDNGIKAYDLDFYSGKDDGYFIRFESIIILNTIFYILMAIWRKPKLTVYLKQAGLGFVIAIVVGLIGYLVTLSVNDNGLTYHILVIIICYCSCFVINGRQLSS
ncbi:hypothetical protein D3C87_337360 [compost metagenome]